MAVNLWVLPSGREEGSSPRPVAPGCSPSPLPSVWGRGAVQLGAWDVEKDHCTRNLAGGNGAFMVLGNPVREDVAGGSGWDLAGARVGEAGLRATVVLLFGGSPQMVPR